MNTRKVAELVGCSLRELRKVKFPLAGAIDNELFQRTMKSTEEEMARLLLSIRVKDGMAWFEETSQHEQRTIS